MLTPRRSLVTLLVVSLLGFSVVTSQADSGTGSGVANSSLVNNIRESEYAPEDTQHLNPLFQIVGMPIRNALGSATPTGTAAVPDIGYTLAAPVIINPNIYVIWYGSWTTAACTKTADSTTPAVINDMLKGIGSSSWYGINTRYYQQESVTATKQYVTNVVKQSGCIVDSGSLGKSNPNMAAIVDSALTKNLLPRDTNGIYFVFTTSDVSVSGFLTRFCGYHTHYKPSYSATADIKFSFVGDPSSRLASCNGQAVATSPNANPAADAMSSVIAHELVETVSDPDLNAWNDSAGNENADKCAWAFGTTGNMTNGSKYNLVIGSRAYYIQQNWIPDSPQACGMALTSTPLPPPPPPVVVPLSVTVAVASKNAMVTQAVTAFSPITVSGGGGTKTYSISPALPAGLTLNATTGAIAGTPTASLLATTETVTVTDSVSGSLSGAFTLKVSPVITATVSVASQTIVHSTAIVRPAITPFTPITGGGSTFTPLVYTISPALPTGLTISTSTGAISGTTPATATAKKTYKVTITDAGGFTASASFSLTIS